MTRTRRKDPNAWLRFEIWCAFTLSVRMLMPEMAVRQRFLIGIVFAVATALVGPFGLAWNLDTDEEMAAK